MEVSGFRTIRYVEVKWVRNDLPFTTIEEVVASARTFPSGTFLLEVNKIDEPARAQLEILGGIELR